MQQSRRRRGFGRWSFTVLILGLMVGLAPLPVLGQVGLGSREELRRLEETLARVADEVRPKVVAIRAERRIVVDRDEDLPDDAFHRRLSNRTIPAVGTGMLISTDGKILTNEHVVQNAWPEDIEVLLANGDAYPVMDVTTDPRCDMAVIRIDAEGMSPVTFCDVEKVRQGHFTIVMGNPYGAASDNFGAPSMSFGIVSALGQELTDQLDPMRQRYYGNLIQTDARINPGNSGGPLMNIHGEVIGITTAISTRSGGNEGIGYAIPIDPRAKAIIDDLSNGREVEYGLLGVELRDPSTEDRRSAGSPRRLGALVSDVRFGSPAHDAGLKNGDIITGYNRVSVDSVDHLVRLVGASRAGLTVPMEYYRKGEKVRVDVSPARRGDVIPGLNVHTWRGIRFANATAQVRQHLELDDEVSGVVVLSVADDTPAAKAGFARGQMIAKVGEADVMTVGQLRPRLAEAGDGKVAFTLKGEEAKTLELAGEKR